jgi:hypothetical protein
LSDWREAFVISGRYGTGDALAGPHPWQRGTILNRVRSLLFLLDRVLPEP